jgi:hypothetical protein
MSRASMVAIAVSLVVAAVAVANPIPDTSIDEMNNLARRWSDGLSETESARLVGYWGRYPFEFWAEDVGELVEQGLGEYLPALAACQEPGHAINFELQRWFRSIASDSQRQAMCAVLRRWLTDEMTTAPPDGDMQITGPGSHVRFAIVMGRVNAAEVLSDYGDSRAEPLIEALTAAASADSAARDPLWELRHGSPAWLLEQALARLRDPDVGYVLRERGGDLQLAGNLGPVLRASFGQTFSRAYEPMPVDPPVAQRLFAMLAECRPAPTRVRSFSGLSLDVVFADGRRAQVNLGNIRPELVYEDNMRAEHPQISLANESLYDELEAIHRSQQYADWRRTHPKKEGA